MTSPQRAILFILSFIWMNTAHAEPDIQVTAHKESHGVALVASSSVDSDYTLTLELTDAVNVAASCDLPATFVSDDQKPLVLCHLRIINPSKKWSYHYNYHFMRGVAGPAPSKPAIYTLPFLRGETHKVVQGNFGTFSHNAGSPNEYAVDWSASPGTTVCAARGGIVTGVKQDSDAGGLDPSFMDQANYIIIGQTDGTYAEYLHLQLHGALVKIGDAVTTGQPIGKSGATGHVSGPHVHFAVFVPIDGYHRKTLPFELTTTQGTVSSTDLKEGQEFRN